jgi:uncharacterized protein YutE (UPF0331/DUF86 family)
VADEGLRVPTTYRAVFGSLASAGWIPHDLADRLSGWAGLRNIIAHSYVDLDLGRVHDALGEREVLATYAALVSQRVLSE